MTTEERLEKMERALATVKNRNKMSHPYRCKDWPNKQAETKIFLVILVLISFSWGQDHPDTLITAGGREFVGYLVEITGDSITFHPSGSLSTQTVSKDVVKKVILADGTVAFGLGTDVTYFGGQSGPPEPKITESELYKPTSTEIGSGLIVASGVLGLIAVNRECNDCETVEDLENFIDSQKILYNTSYASLAVGGILMILGKGQ